MIERQAGEFIAVPYAAVCVNGNYLRGRLNSFAEPYSGYWALIAPNGKAVDSESGRPYLYETFDDAVTDSAKLTQWGDYSTCS